MRAIVFLLLIVLVFLIVRFTLNRIIEIRQQSRQKDQEQTLDTSKAEAMVQCAECGIHLPQSSAYYDGQDTFCSEGHMQDYHDKKPDNR